MGERSWRLTAKGEAACSPHRYVIVRQGVPVYTTPDPLAVLAYLWGRDLAEGYVVSDYEQPHPVDNSNRTVWIQTLGE